MDANGGGHPLPNGAGGHALPNGAGHANGLPNGVGGHGQAEHAVANGGGHANGAGGHGLAHGGGHANGLPNGVVPAQAAAVNPDGVYLAFLRLPAQEIARCRTVCRLWRDITATEAFRRDHHRHPYRTPMPLFFFFLQTPALARANLHAVDFRGRESRPVMRVPLNHEAFRIHGSCLGILLLSFGDRLYACNPCTRRWAPLPPLHVHNDIVGFYLPGPGLYPPGGFVFQVLYHDRQEPDCDYRVFGLGAGAPPQVSIGRPGPVGDDHLDLVLANGIAPSQTIPPVYVLVYLCWLPQATRDNSDILMFDTVAQSFHLIPPPTIQVDGEDIPVGVGGVAGQGQGQLLEIGEHLAMAVISQARVDVWIRSNTTDLWNRHYLIIPLDGYHQTGGVVAVPSGSLRDRNGSVQCPHMLSAQHGTFLSRHTIEESLLLHPDILPLQDTDAIDGDLPFFTNQ